jgi:hypothetical protein
MNQQQDPSTDFEERLLDQLRAVVAERGIAAAAEPAIATRARRPALRLALAGAGVAVVAGAALIAVAGGDGTSAAYAVEPQAGGQVRVEIRSLEDAHGLEGALAESGIQADVNYLPAGMACREPRFTPAKAGASKTTQGIFQSPSGNVVFTIDRDAVGAGQTLVLTASPGPGGEGDAVQTAVAEGGVAPCVQVPAGQAAPPLGADGHAGTSSEPRTNQSGDGADSGPSLNRHEG